MESYLKFVVFKNRMAKEEDLEARKAEIWKRVGQGYLNDDEAELLIAAETEKYGMNGVKPAGEKLKEQPRKSHKVRNFFILLGIGLFLGATPLLKNLIKSRRLEEIEISQPGKKYETPKTPATSTVEQEKYQIEEEPEIDAKYTSNAYGEVRRWTNAGDLELRVNNCNLSKERIKTYTGWMLYTNITFKNLIDKNLVLDLSRVIDLVVAGNYFDTKEERSRIEYVTIPPYVSINRTFSWNVTNYNNHYARIRIPKFKKEYDTSKGIDRAESYGAYTYINLLELRDVSMQ